MKPTKESTFMLIVRAALEEKKLHDDIAKTNYLNVRDRKSKRKNFKK